MPTASIVMPAYNAEADIGAALESVFAQTWADFECIVIDDGSTDNTATIIKSFSDRRLRYYAIPNSGGPARPRNRGIQLARGEYIFLFDADDLMHPQKLALSLDAFKQYPEADFLFTNYSSIDEQGNTLNSNHLDEYDSLWLLLSEGKKTRQQLIHYDLLYPALIKVNFIGTSSVAVRRSALSAHHQFNEQLRNSDDRLFLLLFAKHHQGIFLNETLHRYRIRQTGISSRGFSERGVSKIEALKIIRSDCEDKSLHSYIDSQIAKDFASIAYDYKTKGLVSSQWENALKSLRYRYNWWAIKLMIHALVFMIRNAIGKKHHGK